MWTSFLYEETVSYLNLTSPLDLSNVLTHRKHSFSRKQDCSNKNYGANNNMNQALNTSQCDSPTYDKRAIQDIASQEHLLPTLLEFDQQQREEVFHLTLFSCNVCFVEKLGAQCIRFADCDHVYCQDCMAGYFEVQIGDGSVKALFCPSDKCESQALPSQVGVS